MVKEHSYSEKENLLLPLHGLLFYIVLFYMHNTTDRIAQTIAFVTPVMKHWLELEKDESVQNEGLIR